MIMRCTIPTATSQLIKTKFYTRWILTYSQYSFWSRPWVKPGHQELYIACISPIFRPLWVLDYKGKRYKHPIKA